MPYYSVYNLVADYLLVVCNALSENSLSSWRESNVMAFMCMNDSCGNWGSFRAHLWLTIMVTQLLCGKEATLFLPGDCVLVECSGMEAIFGGN